MNRRTFLTATPALALLPGVVPEVALAGELDLSKPPRRTRPANKRLAVIATTYNYLSHAYHIAGRFINGYQLNGQHHFPESDIASMHVVQLGKKDLSVGIAKANGIRHCPTLEEALTLGTGKLAVDGVLIIGEHGEYPYNAKGQKLYPRYELFQQVVKVFEHTGRCVPVFNDKHLSYDRKKGFAMVATAKRMGFPLLAGSSLPVTWRRPELELPLGTKMTEAMVVGPGELEIYGIHELEPLQAMVERRTDRQQGVKRVEYLEGAAIWKAGDDKRWSWELLESCLGRSQSRNNGDPRDNCKHFASPPTWSLNMPSPRAFLIEYRDGLKATVLQLDGHVSDITFAARVTGEKKPASTLFWLPPPPGAAFLEALGRHVETMIDTGKSPLPAERTMLSGGILDWALESRVQGKALETPDLDISYAPPKDSGFMRGSYVTDLK